MTNETDTNPMRFTNALRSMRILFTTKEAVYVRLPEGLQRDCGGCGCAHCKKNPALAKWDTLAIPRNADRAHEFTYTVHIPQPAVDEAREYWKRKGELIG